MRGPPPPFYPSIIIIIIIIIRLGRNGRGGRCQMRCAGRRCGCGSQLLYRSVFLAFTASCLGRRRRRRRRRRAIERERERERERESISAALAEGM